MPIYEYHCDKCGDFETMQRMSDKPLTKCPTCRSKVTKLISSTTFHLKGSGWYITDYARKGEGGGGKAEKTDKKGDDKKAESTASASDTTSAGDTSTKPAKSEKSEKSDKSSGKKSEKAAVA
jgi:putative FmdB family regulatory protein